MRKYISILGAILAVVLLTSLVLSDVHTAEYKGSGLCKMCHKLTNKESTEAYEKTAHMKAMMKPDAEGAIVGDFENNPVFTKDKVAFVLGKGQREQAYLDANQQVLPAKWDSVAKKWRPTQAADGATQCVACHTVNCDPAKKAWTEMGVGCESCHGPGSEHNAGDANAIVKLKALDKTKQAMVCGQCHSAGKDPSGKYAHPIGYRPGDDLAKCFVDSKPTVPGRNQQYSEFVQSKMYAAGIGCTTCHDPHGKTGLKYQLVKAENDLCLECHAAKITDMKTHAPTAAADATCGSCHMHGGVHTFVKPPKE
jgi:predicted CXXCH cytochrome family protein